MDKLALSDPLPELFLGTPEETLQSFSTRASSLWEIAQRPNQTVREFLTAAALQGEHPTFRGGAIEIAAELTRWVQCSGWPFLDLYFPSATNVIYDNSFVYSQINWAYNLDQE